MTKPADQPRALVRCPAVDVDEELQRARDNQAALDACHGPHDFQPMERDPAAPLAWSTSRCTRCAGVVTWLEARWYARGLAHGRAGPR